MPGPWLSAGALGRRTRARPCRAVGVAAGVAVACLVAAGVAPASGVPAPSRSSPDRPAAATAPATAAATAPATPEPGAAAYGATVRFVGRGFGHGRGMGQYGAYGYAIEQGWSTAQILDHYYGGTTAGATDPAAVVGVRLVAQDGRDVVVVQPAGRLVTSAPPLAGQTLPAIRLVRAGTGTWNVFRLVDPSTATVPPAVCAAGAAAWALVGTVPGPVTLDVVDATDDTTDLPAAGVPGSLLGVCQSDGGVRYYRGDLVATEDAGSTRTVNRVAIDQYLRGVVVREMPASWGDAAGGAGMQALQAQAVAARSYARALNRFPQIGAQLCDTQSCQVYGGVAVQNAAGAFTRLEDARTDRAVAGTAGQVRLNGAGAVVATEYSSSTGGWTAGGIYPAVADVGDRVASNPHRSWEVAVPVTTIRAAYPSVGALVSIDVVARNGVGDWGGRVTSVRVRGSAATVTVTGEAMRRSLGLKSDWFSVESAFVTSPAVAVASASVEGFWLAGADGAVVAVDGAPFHGSLAGLRLNAPIVHAAARPDGAGYWLLGRDGGVFAFNAPFFGSTGSIRLNRPVVAMAPRPQGDGYWFVASDGGIFSYGAAPFVGSMGGRYLVQPVVGMAPTPSGQGYWLVAADGGIFSFGDARFFGSIGGRTLNRPIVGMVARPQGDGYWFVASDGGVFAFGAATFLGGLGGQTLASPIVGMTTTASGNGYRLLAANGATYPFGDAG